MTPREIALVQASWREVQPIGEAAAAMLYARLFELDPSLQRLFKGDMTQQGRKVMAMISVARALPKRWSRPGAPPTACSREP